MIKTKEKKHILYEIRQNLETIVYKNRDYTQELCLVLNKMAKLALGEINSNSEKTSRCLTVREIHRVGLNKVD